MMTDLLEGLAIFIVGAAFILGLFAFFGWAVASLVSFIFEIDFGFWKGVATVVLLGILNGVRIGGGKE
jgi:hypothetical protein